MLGWSFRSQSLMRHCGTAVDRGRRCGRCRAGPSTHDRPRCVDRWRDHLGEVFAFGPPRYREPVPDGDVSGLLPVDGAFPGLSLKVKWVVGDSNEFAVLDGEEVVLWMNCNYRRFAVVSGTLNGRATRLKMNSVTDVLDRSAPAIRQMALDEYRQPLTCSFDRFVAPFSELFGVAQRWSLPISRPICLNVR